MNVKEHEEREWEKPEKTEKQEIEVLEDAVIPEPKTPSEKFFASLAIGLHRELKRTRSQIQLKNAEVEQYKVEAERAKTSRSLEHIEFVSLSGQIDQMSEEMDAAKKREVNADQRMESRLLMERAYSHSIDDLVQGRQSRNWLKFGWEIVAIFIVFLVAFWAPFRTLIFQNLLVIVVGGALLAYIAWRVNKGKKK